MFAFCGNHFCPSQPGQVYLRKIPHWFSLLYISIFLEQWICEECQDAVKKSSAVTQAVTHLRQLRVEKKKGYEINGIGKAKYAYLMQIACADMVITAGNTPLMSQTLELVLNNYY